MDINLLVIPQIYGCQNRLWKLKGDAEEKAKNDLIEVLKTLESELGDRPYFGGDSFGFVDIALVPFTSWFLAYEKLGGFSIEEHCPTIAAWAKLCRERESVAMALTDPDKVEFVQFLQTKFGPCNESTALGRAGASACSG
jgi:glutathione S-transferase